MPVDLMQESQEKEIWKPIKGYEGRYFVSNLGRIKSEKILTQFENVWGYPQVAFSEFNRIKRFSVHRLVAEAFCSNPKNKPFVNHIDFKRNNNNEKNLEYVTLQENSKHSLINIARGERQGISKLIKKDVLTIRKLYKRKIKTSGELAKQFGVSKATIFHIINRRTWRHI